MKTRIPRKKSFKAFVNPLSELEKIISARLNLQTTKNKIANDFDLPFLTLGQIKNSDFKSKFNSWPAEKQEAFAAELGGIVNVKRTSNYLKLLLKD